MNQTIDPKNWVKLYGDALYRYAHPRVSNHQIAEDLVQDTFLSALDSLESFRGDSQIQTWLIAILKRKIIDYYRTKRITYSFDSDENEDIVDDFETAASRHGQWNMERAPRDWGNMPDHIVENQQFRQILDKCIGELPEKFSGAFIMREMDGYHTKEICKVFGITPSNLWVILHRARHLLRKCLEINWLGKNNLEK